MTALYVTHGPALQPYVSLGASADMVTSSLKSGLIR